MLPVSAPFHSSLLEPAAARLKEYLASIDFNAPRIDVVNNVDVAVVHEPSAIKTALSRQACSPVRWVEVMSSMVAAGITHTAECGPGRVLAGLAKRIAPALHVSTLADPNALVQTLEAIQ
jgi:[acyl-carrier-protein] S-malonyltransferase